ncbi:(2Fe-2S)-binding protein [Desulfosediminicola flagellatus]|uniref:(2Fe-2S)-binding protein n=1 Tax=Desulfosediminicola flagellatus TaxID=2569541 RepID=UPI0010ABBF11|nr:(2Fe-2S)-binding protein [Desulfosediminicola flagellatus]
MFKHDSSTTTSIEVILDGQPTTVPAEMNLAAALLAIGKIVSKISPTSKKPCSPHCLMGVCFECLMEIDGVQRQACMTTVTEGMVINRNLGEEGGLS